MSNTLWLTCRIGFVLLCVFVAFSFSVKAEDDVEAGYPTKFSKAYDIYLTENRICRKCKGRYLDAERVELKNRKGDVGIYPLSEIVGVDNHPISRKIWLRSFRGVGLPGRIIVPEAFEDEKHVNY